MKQTVVLSAVGAGNVPKAAAFLNTIIRSGLPQQFDFVALLPVGSPLADLCWEHGVEAITMTASPEVLHGELTQLGGRKKIRVIHAHSSLDHLVAVAWRQSQQPELLVIATRYEEERLAKTARNQRIHCHATAVNLFLETAVRDAMYYQTPDGCLKVANPMLLEQPGIGADGILTMLEHCYLALLEPTRKQQISGEKRSYAHIRLAYITHFYCNQQDISSVRTLLETYATYPEELRDRVQFVIVDDGSPIDYEIPELPLNLTWLKIDQDIRWNQAGARNLGALYAKADNILLLDLDHEVPPEAMRRLVERSSCGKRLYKMYREEPGSGRVYKGHSNLFFMSRGRFFELFGYDEEFAGNYGAEDFRFVKYQRANGTFQTYLPKNIRCFERGKIDRKRSYHSLVRDLSFNTPVDSRKKMELEHYGHGAGHSRMFLNFTWKILADRWRDPAPPLPVDRWWKKWAPLRQILPRF